MRRQRPRPRASQQLRPCAGTRARHFILFRPFCAHIVGQGITIASSFLINLSDRLQTLWLLSFLSTEAPTALGAPCPSRAGRRRGNLSARRRFPAGRSRREARLPRLPGNGRCGGEGGPGGQGRGRDAGPGAGAVPHHRQGRAAAAGLQPPLAAGATGPGEPWPAAGPPRTPPFRAAPPRRFVPGHGPRPLWPPPGPPGAARPLPPSLLVPLLSLLGGAGERWVWCPEPCLSGLPLGPKDFAVKMKTIRLKSHCFKYRSWNELLF